MQDNSLLCLECVKNEHLNHNKMHVTDLVFKLNEKLNEQLTKLSDTISFVDMSHVA